MFGYKSFDTLEGYQNALEDLFLKKIMPNLDKGLSILVYTQFSDVEDEVNGLVTYDRRILKVNEQAMQHLNNQLYSKFKQIVKLEDR